MTLEAFFDYTFFILLLFIFPYARRKVVIHGGKVFLRREGNFSFAQKKGRGTFLGLKQGREKS